MANESVNAVDDKQKLVADFKRKLQHREKAKLHPLRQLQADLVRDLAQLPTVSSDQLKTLCSYLTSEVIDTNQFPIFSNDDHASHLLEQFLAQHRQLCNEQSDAIRSIVSCTANANTSSIKDLFSYFVRGHLYHGQYKAYTRIIYLVQRLHILDPNRVVLLNSFLNEIQHVKGAEETATALIEYMIITLDSLQSALLSDLETQIEAKVTRIMQRCLKEDKHISPDARAAIKNSILNLSDPEDDISLPIHFKDGGAINLARYKISRYQTKILAQRAAIEKALKDFKRDIHHAAEELNLPSTIERCEQKNKTQALTPFYQLAEKSNNGLTADSKKHRRRVKKINYNTATAASVVLGVGEGAVAGVGIAVFAAALLAPPALPIAIALGISVFIAGAITNYFLGRSTTYDILNQWRFGNLFVDQHGRPASRATKMSVIMVSLIPSLAGGFIYAAISANAIFISVLTPLISFAGGSAFLHVLLIAGAVGLVCLPVVGLTAVAMTCIFFFVLRDFVLNKRWNDIGKYFKEHFYAPWSELTAKERAWHITNCALKLGLITIGLALMITVTVISLGCFYNKALNLLALFATPKNPARIIAWTASGITSSVAFLFGTKDSLSVLLQACTLRRCLALPARALVALASLPFRAFHHLSGGRGKTLVDRFNNTQASLKKWMTTRAEQRTASGVPVNTQRAAHRHNHSSKAFAAFCVVLNATGQAAMFIQGIRGAALKTWEAMGAMLFSAGPNVRSWFSDIENATVQPLSGKTESQTAASEENLSREQSQQRDQSQLQQDTPAKPKEIQRLAKKVTEQRATTHHHRNCLALFCQNQLQQPDAENTERPIVPSVRAH